MSKIVFSLKLDIFYLDGRPLLAITIHYQMNMK